MHIAWSERAYLETGKEVFHDQPKKPEDMDYLVAASDGCTGAQVAELANTIYMVSVDERAFESDNGSVRRVAVNRELLDTALREIQTDQKPVIGFSAA